LAYAEMRITVSRTLSPVVPRDGRSVSLAHIVRRDNGEAAAVIVIAAQHVVTPLFLQLGFRGQVISPNRSWS